MGRVRAQAISVLLLALVVVCAATPPARAEVAPTDLLVAPPGAELVTRHGGAIGAVAGDFLDGYDDLDVTAVDGATGVIRDGLDPAVLITVVRLGSEREAAEALAALGRPISTDEILADPASAEWMTTLGAENPYVQALPAPGPGAVGRRAVMSSDYSLVEFARATGRDLIVFAQLGGDGAPHPIMHAALDAHRAAFPDVTMPADTGIDRTWLRAAGTGTVLLAALGLLVSVAVRRRRAGRDRTTPLAPQFDGGRPPGARVNW